MPSSSSRKRKSRRSAAVNEDPLALEEPMSPVATKASRRSNGEDGRFNAFVPAATAPEDFSDDGDLNGEHHPDCTSVEDCLGQPGDRLVRHMISDGQGDIYCETCWASFLQSNPQLEGVWEDGDMAGAPYSSRRR
mmetsp:Transcript_38798/g.88192  ORF Transcript_38798/g.88192 Transcript_38798/m.88192 type:complete len:135 (-) Transcript_38798:143-547(-)